MWSFSSTYYETTAIDFTAANRDRVAGRAGILPQSDSNCSDSRFYAGANHGGRGEAAVAEPRRKLVRWNEFEGPFFTLGYGTLERFEHKGVTQFFQSPIQIQL